MDQIFLKHTPEYTVSNNDVILMVEVTVFQHTDHVS